MKNIFKIYLFSSLLLTDFMAFAQSEPGSGGSPEDAPVEGTDAAPINSKLVFLFMLGILYAFYKIRKYQKTA